MRRRILYVHFGDPAFYPPIEHSSGILADRGWNVVLLGTNAFGAEKLKLPSHPRIRVRTLSLARAGGMHGALYVVFAFRALLWTWIWRPEWIYVSDPLALPASWLIRKLTKARMIYHEHDAPNSRSGRSRFMRMVLACRKVLGREVELCVVPQHERLVDFLKVTGRVLPTICAWNCPRLDEAEGNNSEQVHELIIWYHGSINSARVPPELVVAASRFQGAVRLRIAGYETAGSVGYVDNLMNVAAKNGAPKLIEFLGSIPHRKDLLKIASKADVGLSLMPKTSEDINMRHMVGASNKPFDCMASGLPLLVTDLPEWTQTFVKPRYARACDPADVGSIEAELRWYLDHPEERREMGRRCADKIRQAWNYDAAFAEVITTLENH
jgi:glycosyltransferase involved in cell wall biosynthesis